MNHATLKGRRRRRRDIHASKDEGRKVRRGDDEEGEGKGTRRDHIGLPTSFLFFSPPPSHFQVPVMYGGGGGGRGEPTQLFFLRSFNGRGKKRRGDEEVFL